MDLISGFDIQQWWSTPIVKIELNAPQQFNARLADIIREKEREILADGVASKVAGLAEGLTAHWLEYNVFNWDYPECLQLRDIALAGFKEFLKAARLEKETDMDIVGISCWANILRSGQALDVHHHDPAFVSAHYTVATGLESIENSDVTDSGHTVYFRPGFMERSHGGKQNGWVSPWDDDWRISSKPQAGKMIFFPSYVRHEVRHNLGMNDRISIAMDFFIKRQNPMMYFGGPRWYVPKGNS